MTHPSVRQHKCTFVYSQILEKILQQYLDFLWYLDFLKLWARCWFEKVHGEREDEDKKPPKKFLTDKLRVVKVSPGIFTAASKLMINYIRSELLATHKTRSLNFQHACVSSEGLKLVTCSCPCGYQQQNSLPAKSSKTVF